MESPEEPYYKLNRKMLSLIGLWPHDNNRIGRITVMLMIFVSHLLIELIKLIFWEYNLELYLKMLSFNFLTMQWAVKYITFYAAMKNIKKIQEYVRNNWSTLRNNIEIEIITEGAHKGNMYNIIIAVLVFLFMSVYLFLMYIPNTLLIVMPLNESRRNLLWNTTEYFISQQKYVYMSTLQLTITLLGTVFAAVATETFSLSSALHAFAMFKLASYRIGCILNENDQPICTTKKYALYHDRITAAVDTHRRATEFSNLLVATFGIPYLTIFFISVCSESIYLFLILTKSLGPFEILVFVACILSHILFLTIGNFVGQEFINCDLRVYKVLCNIRWYNAPLKTQKLILIMMQKATRGYKVAAGGLFSPSLQGLTTSMSLTYSFIMILCYTQK